MLPSFRGAVKRPKPIVVHLGNVGLDYHGEIPARRTLKFASRFKNFNFFGIDLRPWMAERRNWTQVQMDLLNGLDKLKNNSVSLISSEMTLGYYGPRKLPSNLVASEAVSMGYAFEVMKKALQKLKPRGKLIVVIDSQREKALVQEGISAGFEISSIHRTRMRKSIPSASYWTNSYSAPNMSPEETTMVKLVFQKSSLT